MSAGLHLSYFYDIPLPSRWAAGIQILNTGRALCELGVRVTVYSNQLLAPDVATCLAFYGLEPHPLLQIVPFFRSRWSRATFDSALYQVVHSLPHGAKHILMSRGETGVELYARVRNVPAAARLPFVYEAHRLCFTEVERGRLPWLWRRRSARMREREGQVVQQASGLVCLTRRVYEALRHEFDVTSPTLVLPSGVTLPRRPPRDDADRDIDVLYAGKIERRKGVDDLVAAMRFLPAYRLWIAGGTPREIDDLRRHAVRLNVEQRIIFTGFIPPRDITDLYERARVGVCPLPSGSSRISAEWTSPLKVLQMMASGTPIIGTDVPALRALLRHERTALLVEPGRPAALAGAIATLLEDRQLARRLAREAQAQSAAFAWERRATHLLAFLDGLL